MMSATIASVALASVDAFDAPAPAKTAFLAKVRAALGHLVRPFAGSTGSPTLARSSDANLADIGLLRTDVDTVRAAYTGALHSD